MDTSAFMDKAIMPDDTMLNGALCETFAAWKEIQKVVYLLYPKATEEWSFSGPKYGWSFRIRDKKRVIVYLLPRDKYFLAAFVFGEKATQLAMVSELSSEIKATIQEAKVYAEGRGFRVEMRSMHTVKDIRKLIEIKLGY